MLYIGFFGLFFFFLFLVYFVEKDVIRLKFKSYVDVLWWGVVS